MKAVIVAGGKGTRLAAVTGTEIPKPMVSLCGKPILQHQIEVLYNNGVSDIIILTGYLHERIEEYFGDGSEFGVKIEYITEQEPLGTGGALTLLRGRVERDFLLVFGDLIFDIDVERMWQFHQRKKAEITLLAHPNNHPYDSDLLLNDEEGRVRGFVLKKEGRGCNCRNLVNAGIYMVNRNFLERLPQRPEKLDLEKDLIAKHCPEMDVYAYRSPEYVKDVGTPERLRQAERELEAGIVRARNLNRKQKCVFLDRDGTINCYVGLLTDKDSMKLEKNAAEAIRRLNQSEYLCVVITNQPVVARNLCSQADLQEIHNRMENLLGQEGAYIDDLLYCPHHPDKGYPEENILYKKRCNCRKPQIGLLKQCEICYNIDLSKSWFIGDTTTDVQTGRNAGCKTILLGTGQGGQDGKYMTEADYRCGDLLEAAKLILCLKHEGEN